jgi:hypothetical protein
MRLIWCQSGNPASARLAVAAGWWYGFRSDGNHYASELGPVAILDSHWEEDRIDWPRHLDQAAQHRPWLATVPDVLALGELDRALLRGEEIAPHCDRVLVVPKAEGIIERLPRALGGKPVVLGYSVPTSYGGTELGLWSFQGWPVHLLGGNARTQADLCRYLRVVSADGNLAWRLARRGIVVNERGVAGPTLRQMDGQSWPARGAHLEALRRSLANLRTFWGRHAEVEWRPAEAALLLTPKRW